MFEGVSQSHLDLPVVKPNLIGRLARGPRDKKGVKEAGD